jgi:hypothetical protein
MSIIKKVQSTYQQLMEQKPLTTILFIALIVRLIAAFFAKGYGMHDDHYLVIEASQSWVDGTDFDNWLPKSQVDPKPEGHSFFYVGIHYLLFLLIKFLGITNPDTKMIVIRVIHAVFSLLVVWSGYKIALKYSTQRNANLVGMLLAVFWFMPFLAVRNLVEIVAIPLLMYGVYLVIDAPDRAKPKWWFFAGGLILGVAFSVRFQTLLFVGGVGLVLLFTRKFIETVIFGIGVLLSIALIQGIVDIFIWGRPFAELTEYVLYNIANKNNYGYNNYLMYPEVILGILIPPMSIFWVYGFSRTWKKFLLVFVPTTLFFLFHEYFPNKQERFILTIVPLIIVTGVIGWNEFVERSAYWQRHQKFLRGSMKFFWIFNFVVLALITTAYSKKSRIEAMLYLHDYRANIDAVVLDNNHRDEPSFIPLFYLGKWVDIYQVNKNLVLRDTLNYFPETRYQKAVRSIVTLDSISGTKKPQYVIFYYNTNLEERVADYKQYYPDLTYETTIEPSNLDKLMHWLNPNNLNQVVIIYRTQKEAFAKEE